jgi:hypothetical protein
MLNLNRTKGDRDESINLSNSDRLHVESPAVCALLSYFETLTKGGIAKYDIPHLIIYK